MEQEVTSSLFCFTDTTFISSSFVCLSVPALSLVLYILKSGVLLQSYRPIITYDYSVRMNHVNVGVNGFFRGCSLFSSKHAHVRVGFFDYRSFWYMPLSIIGSFPFILHLAILHWYPPSDIYRLLVSYNSTTYISHENRSHCFVLHSLSYSLLYPLVR